MRDVIPDLIGNPEKIFKQIRGGNAGFPLSRE
jgi:hypothetical protein